MYNNIVRETSSEIRSLARRALKGNWWQVFLGVLLFYILMGTIPEILDSLFSFGHTYTAAELSKILENGDLEKFKGLTVTTGISGLYTTALTGAFTAGLCSFMMAFFRKEEINSGHIFDGFEYYLKTLALMLLMGLFIFLWGLLLIVPGIIAAIRYSQAFYILADDPRKGVMQCLEESKRMMYGNKSKYFSLMISFIGWYIVAGICTGIIASVLSMVTYVIEFRAVAIILGLISAVPGIFLLEYVQTACTAFYDLASGHLIARPRAIDDVDVDSENY